MVAHVITIVVIRSCGSNTYVFTVAEKIFIRLRDVAEKNPGVHCIAVSHSDQAATEKWLQDVGGSGKLELVVDHDRQSFSEYGLGPSSFWAVLNPWSMLNAMTIGKQEGFNIRPTESGSRWQTAGLFASDGNGKLTYSHRANTSDDLGDLEAALNSVKST